MRIAVFMADSRISMQIANDVSRYFYLNRPEYHVKVVDFSDFKVFDAIERNYGYDLYIIEVSECVDRDFGYRISKTLRKRGNYCCLFFVTLAGEMAIDLFRAALRPDYVFLKAVERSELEQCLETWISSSSKSGFIEFVCDYRRYLVNIDNIIYATTSGNRLLILCQTETLESSERLADIESRLPDYFIRVDKGCLINTRKLAKADFTGQKAEFTGGEFVYMSRRGTKKLFDMLGKNRGTGIDEISDSDIL